MFSLFATTLMVEGDVTTNSDFYVFGGFYAMMVMAIFAFLHGKTNATRDDYPFLGTISLFFPLTLVIALIALVCSKIKDWWEVRKQRLREIERHNHNSVRVNNISTLLASISHEYNPTRIHTALGRERLLRFSTNLPILSDYDQVPFLIRRGFQPILDSLMACHSDVEIWGNRREQELNNRLMHFDRCIIPTLSSAQDFTTFQHYMGQRNLQNRTEERTIAETFEQQRIIMGDLHYGTQIDDSSVEYVDDDYEYSNYSEFCKSSLK